MDVTRPLSVQKTDRREEEDVVVVSIALGRKDGG